MSLLGRIRNWLLGRNGFDALANDTEVRLLKDREQACNEATSGQLFRVRDAFGRLTPDTDPPQCVGPIIPPGA